MVPKTNDEIYVSISISKYIFNFHLFPVLCQRRYCCLKYQKWGSHLKNRHHYAKMVQNAKINFSISPYCTLLFTRKKNFKCLDKISGHLLAFLKNGHKSTQTRFKVCSNLTSLLQQLSFVSLVSYLLTLITFHTLL